MVRVCEIELSHMGKANGNPYPVCENVHHIFISKECIKHVRIVEVTGHFSCSK